MNSSVVELTSSGNDMLGRLHLAELARTAAVDYLHHGRALDLWSEFLPREQSSAAIADLVSYLRRRKPGGLELERLISAYRRSHGRFTFGELKQAFDESIEWRERFRLLGCRGFSYSLNLGMRGYNGMRHPACQLSAGVDIRLALMPHRELFYPAGVKRYVRRAPWSANHYFHKKTPAIAFCFGRKLQDAWYVLVLQSDVASKGPACVREHFRGWRSVLFANVVAQALGKAARLYLCRALDVERACFPETKETGCIPEAWTSIYDRTAKEWGMRLVTVECPVDVQIYSRQKPVYSREFYELSL